MCVGRVGVAVGWGWGLSGVQGTREARVMVGCASQRGVQRRSGIHLHACACGASMSCRKAPFAWQKPPWAKVKGMQGLGEAGRRRACARVGGGHVGVAAPTRNARCYHTVAWVLSCVWGGGGAALFGGSRALQTPAGRASSILP